MATKVKEVSRVFHNDVEMQSELQQQPLAVVDVFSSFVGPCNAILPSYKKFKSDISDKLSFYQAEADSMESFVNFRGHAAPNFLFFSYGTMVNQIRGVNLPLIEKTLRREAANITEDSAQRKMFAYSEESTMPVYTKYVPKVAPTVVAQAVTGTNTSSTNGAPQVNNALDEPPAAEEPTVQSNINDPANVKVNNDVDQAALTETIIDGRHDVNIASAISDAHLAASSAAAVTAGDSVPEGAGSRRSSQLNITNANAAAAQEILRQRSGSISMLNGVNADQGQSRQEQEVANAMASIGAKGSQTSLRAVLDRQQGEKAAEEEARREPSLRSASAAKLDSETSNIATSRASLVANVAPENTPLAQAERKSINSRSNLADHGETIKADDGTPSTGDTVAENLEKTID